MNSPHLSRRAFLSASAAAMAAPYLRSIAPPPNDRFLTFVNMIGGNDALNTLIPTRVPAYAQVRPVLAIAPSIGQPLDTGPFATSDYVLHPAMPNLAQLYREGSVAFVRMAGYPNADQSHFASQDVWSRGGLAPTEPDSGWIARFKDLYAPDPISVVALGLGQQLDFRGGTTPSTFTLPPVPVSRPPYVFQGDPRFPANERLRHVLDEQVAARLRAEGLRERVRAAQLAMYAQLRASQQSAPPPNRPEYPASNLGAVLSSSAEMLRQNQPVKVFYALAGTATDFDTHFDQGTVNGRQADSLGSIDLALLPYVRDLQQQGIWSRAVIVLFSEFGRRNAAPGDGTDHGTGGLLILIGGAVHGGMYGPDLSDEAIRAATMPSEVDFRTVYEELLARHLEVDPVPVFTETYARRPALGVIL